MILVIHFLEIINIMKGIKKMKKKSRSRLEKRPVLSLPIKARINSYKFENETRKLLYFLYQHNKITKNVWNSLIKLL